MDEDGEARSTFTLKFESPEGEEINVTVDYPKDKGLMGVRALREANTDHYVEEVLTMLLDAKDASVLRSYDDFVLEEMEKEL
jgi:hypothetical protein